MGAPFSGGEVQGPAIQDMSEKVSWVEKFVRVGAAANQAARNEHDRRAFNMTVVTRGHAWHRSEPTLLYCLHRACSHCRSLLTDPWQHVI